MCEKPKDCCFNIEAESEKTVNVYYDYSYQFDIDHDSFSPEDAKKLFYDNLFCDEKIYEIYKICKNRIYISAKSGESNAYIDFQCIDLSDCELNHLDIHRRVICKLKKEGFTLMDCNFPTITVVIDT